MRFITLLTILTGLLLCACGGDNDCPAAFVPTLSDFGTYNEDIRLIDEYLLENNLVADTLAGSGLRYIIDSTGTMGMPVVCDEVDVTYEGYFLDETPFDSGGPITFGLSNVITGWQLGIPLFGKGGGGKLFIPSYLAYGVAGRGGIPPNTPLVFDVTLHSF